MKRIILLLTILIATVSCSQSDESNNMKKVDIQLIRNATLKINYNEKTLLVDPSLSSKESFMSFVVPNENLNPTIDLKLSVEEIVTGVEAVLVTHTHVDHLDEGAKNALSPTIPLFAQPIDKQTFEEQTPFTNVNYVEDSSNYHGITIHRTGGKHSSDSLFEVLGEVSGFVLQAENYPTIYIVGDCLWDEEIKKNIKKFNPDIIITNSGGAQFMGETILMDEENTVALAKFAPNAKIVSVHMEALDHCKTTRASLKEKAQEENVEIIIPQDGETIVL
ncbi:MBL fold metallo-hydrolase [Aureivirga marina]|uniref:MBL fold metallo-hydrolase n=1 Tax=Aureivirga marina TaxID=1182451 RepID=UPI0018CBD76E|nr:MBL fold metallo-hydrolase [Aureivirga marina]